MKYIATIVFDELELQRMRVYHATHTTITPSLNASPRKVCMGCGMYWPCPGRRLLDETERATLWRRARHFLART